jgi:hypothetical protein
VKTIRLDDLDEALIDLLVLDVQGAELDVIEAGPGPLEARWSSTRRSSW